MTKEKVSQLSRLVAVDPLEIRSENSNNNCIIVIMSLLTLDQNAYTKSCQDILRKDELVKSVSAWSTSKGRSVQLNQWQQRAIEKAIREPFQLIQGPPGLLFFLGHV